MSPSVMYGFVRGRQLEGTFPGDPRTGVWTITQLRVGRGWGVPPEAAWPYNGNAAAWPPTEPPGLDELARAARIDCYQRVRTIEECKTVLAQGQGVEVSLYTTDQWANAPRGRIAPSADDQLVESHTVVLISHDDAKAEFRFANSWGVEWGDGGYGYLPDAVLEATWFEGWCSRIFPPQAPRAPKTGIVERSWGIREFGGGVLHCREYVTGADERVGWAFALERNRQVEVEELYVRPAHRRKGHGRRLVEALAELARKQDAPLVLWISHADTESENLQAVRKLVTPVGLQIHESGVNWAPYAATEACGPDRGIGPNRPAAARPGSPFRGREES